VGFGSAQPTLIDSIGAFYEDVVLVEVVAESAAEIDLIP
jgi:hypothetical protein